MNLFIYILIIIASIVIDFIIAKEFYIIAAFKGFESVRYFLFPFIFTVIGYMMIVALPDRGKELQKDEASGCNSCESGTQEIKSEPYEERLKAFKKKEWIRDAVAGIAILSILIILFVLSNISN